MSREYSAYAVLGLRFGARPAEVDEAYRRLIKRYHPDRAGGDAGRAAEINHAYTLLRRSPAQAPSPRRAVVVPERHFRRRTTNSSAAALAACLVVISAIAVTAAVAERTGGRPSVLRTVHFVAPQDEPAGAAFRMTDLTQPLHLAVIDRAITDAIQFRAAADSAATADYSRLCQDSLRRERSLAWFDACAAFDEATVALDRVSTSEGTGPFTASAVTTRQWSAARLLSDDAMAADSRIRQIRSRVEFVLVPRLAHAAAEQP